MQPCGLRLFYLSILADKRATEVNMEGVDTDYKPETSGKKPNKHVVANWLWFVVITGICGIPALCGLFIDPATQWLYACNIWWRLFVVFVPVELYLLYRDGRWNGNLFKGIIATPLGCSIFASVVVYSVVILCAAVTH